LNSLQKLYKVYKIYKWLLNGLQTIERFTKFTKQAQKVVWYYKLVPESPECFSQFFESIEKGFLVSSQKMSNHIWLLSENFIFSMCYTPDFLVLCQIAVLLFYKKNVKGLIDNMFTIPLIRVANVFVSARVEHCDCRTSVTSNDRWMNSSPIIYLGISSYGWSCLRFIPNKRTNSHVLKSILVQIKSSTSLNRSLVKISTQPPDLLRRVTDSLKDVGELQIRKMWI
jgi:hypothetical protein